MTSLRFTEHKCGVRLARLFRLTIPHVPAHIAQRHENNDPGRGNRNVHFCGEDLKRYLQGGKDVKIKDWPSCEYEEEGIIEYGFRFPSLFVTCEWKGPLSGIFLKTYNN